MSNFEQILRLAACAVAFAAFFFFIFIITKSKKKSKNAEYDERQVIARGKAFRAGYFTQMIYFSWYLVANTFEFEFLRAYSIAFIFAGIVIGTAVFTVSSIRNDAYCRVGENGKAQVSLSALAVIMNIASAILNYTGSNGQSEVYLLNVLCALLFTVILVTVLIHRKKAAAEGANE